ncbi:type I polyketide synthase [Streptomyces rapamycinicus]|uniref:type I polyketide synthase n=1 Tax=Streptomyces rapamycinicus TaxID=1226757 RepID=UPI00142EAEC1|nr:type I polyketide synthase [Streptomyces rapamycinicus]UTO62420.1 SDR family NAD(P)-dependent oxidoreductase [Streptomyces rapamycinicus]UTP30375.1 SDR family NAD(P)-dependent oxidoreductase [Streptomyces rapamycinicus NRRL 5491]
MPWHHDVHDSVAVIGFSCRLPGARTPEEFWRLLSDGADAVTSVPEDRWTPRQSDGGSGARPEAEAGIEFGAFLDAVDHFDAGFFGISPREAAAMDPQQRLMLELGWESLEDAGLTPARLAQGRTGVFVGAVNDDYATLLRRHGGDSAVTHHTLTGLQRGMIANRLSYLLGTRGPSMVVDSGQSSSLVAVHTACQSLRNGECDTALAGGVHLNLAYDGALSAARFGGLSPDGTCYTFDSRANGFVRGEGGGLVLLKPLARALADGDRIHGVLRGGAVNNDGGGDSLTTPSRTAQAEVLRRAYAVAGVAPDEVQYVELHGTGTPVGDPIEAAALAEAIGAARTKDRPLLVGSAKTNVGHLEGAAGITGLIKVLLALKAAHLPPSLNFRSPNLAIPLEEWNLRVQTELSAWPRPDAPLIAGVSSFGVGGTNAHVVVERAPAVSLAEGAAEGVAEAWGGDVLPWVISGRTPDGVRAQAARLRSFAAGGSADGSAGGSADHSADGDVSPADIGWSLAEHRTALEHRAVVVAADRDGFLAGLDALASGEPSAHVVNGAAGESAAGPVFVFPGQGSQWAGMAAELLDASPVFAESIGRCARALAPHTDWDLLGVLRDTEDGAALDRAEVLQPALWAVMVSLARVWRSLGVVPSAVVGHSQGEIAAACVAGALSLEDGARLIAVRSRIAGALIGRGGLASIGASEERAAELLADRADVWIAAVNGPGATVVGGSPEGLAEVTARAAAAGLRHRRVATAYASHTPHVEAIREEFLRLAAPVAPRAGDVPMYSTVTTAPIAGEALDAEYWYRNLREQVRFHDTVQNLIADGNSLFLESSSHPVLITAVQDTGGLAVGTLRRGEGGTRRVLLSLAELWVHGAAPDWGKVFAGTGARRAALPGRVFQRRRHWFDAVASPAATDIAPGAASPDVVHQVRAQAAAVLGHTTVAELDTGRTFKDLGFDSISLSDLCNRVNAALGTRLSPAALFSHPTPARLAEHLAAGGLSPTPAAVAAPADEPIAIIAMSCRLPGGVHSPEDLWRLVADGRDAISPFPDDRGWDLERLHGTESTGSSFARSGGFIDGATDFDARLFGISPREALAMDPQQRLLLETSWELLERAGIAPDALRATRTGVFVGTMDQEYGPRLHEAPEAVDGYLLTGKTASVASGRIAYQLGLTGPAITLDTACSSSLVALHLAVQSLRRGESSLALAGGVTVLNTPGIFTEFSRQGGLARDGRCKAFAAGADGTGMAEGVGMLLVERLSDARRNGHRVLGVIRGTAVNQDGASNGLTAPNGLSQEQVVRQALADAGLSASDVDLIEAHGTGTALGDPIEAQALLATYGRDRPAERPALLGSVKSNIGHTQAAAGVAGVIKAIMAMRHGVVPATLHVDEPTPHVDWGSGGVELVTEERPWPEAGRARRAGVSSFGISGTNAHVVLEQAPSAPVPVPVPVPAPSRVPRPANPLVEAEGVLPWVVSGRSPAALRAQAARLGAFAAAATSSDATPSDIAWALATQRAAMEHRAVVVAADRDTFLAGLDAIATGEPSAHVVAGVAAGSAAGPVFVFPGQGSQWVGMAAELLDTSPEFAESIDRCAQALAPHIDWDLLDVLRATGDEAALERVDIVQPALWAVMVSLAQVWRSLGIEPSAVIGHSQGEIAAACVAGALTLEDGARLVALRSRLIAQELAGHGGMASLTAPADQARELLTGRDDVWIATVNGPTSTVVAGSPAALTDVMAQAETTGIRARAIAVDYASHTPHVDRIREQLLELAAPITPQAGHVPMYSTVTAAPIDGETLDAEYWYRNLREQVRFHDTLRTSLANGHTLYLEASPHPVLTTAVEETGHAADQRILATGTLRRDQGGVRQYLGALATLWAHGVAPDWAAVFAPGGDTPVDLPTYAFQRERYWLAPVGPGSAVRVDLPSATVAAEGPEGLEALEGLGGFARRVADAAEGAPRLRVVLDQVCRHAAAVLGLSSVDEVETRKVFRDLGFDSLTAVELRNRLAAATGVALAPSVVFDYPTPLTLAQHLLDRITGGDTAGADPYAPGAVVPVVPGATALDEPIAIVATSCRFPAGVRSPEDLWRLLLSDQDTLSAFPADRGWDLDALRHPDPARPGSSYVHQGGFLLDAADFDADFFGISPREAMAMDPQQRLLLETSWEALEHAGIDPLSLRGSRTGVFIGLVPHGYGGEGADTEGSEGYLFTGAAGSVASGRIAYGFGLTGPAVTVDTACSSSLVALHLAVQALRNGDCGMALVGGVSVISTPGVFTEFSHQRGLAPDGRCKPFAAAADGTAWAEGVGVLLVERLSEARRNGHQVLAVIRGTAVNQDGASNGLTAPNGPSQQAVIRQALANARLTPSDIDVIEAHGTGTALGDPIEAQALLATYGQGRSAEHPALLGSMKAHVGHTGAAAGVAGIVKMVLALRNGVVPRTPHVDEPTPQVDWGSGAVRLVTETMSWPDAERARRAAVSSFGVSGTNAHVILEAAPTADPTSQDTPTEGALPWVISARSEAALRAQAAQLRAFVATSDRHLADIGSTLALRRAALEHRAVVVAADRDDFLAGLDAIATGEPSAHVVAGVAAGSAAGPVFVFPGQGSQWVGMAAELLDTSPEFAESIDRCAQALAPHIDWDLLDVLRATGDEAALERVDIVQPALWAVMVSLAQVWRSLGIEPSAVIGHSQGEIAAACVAGALTLEDGARLVALRSRLIAQELAGHGGMASLTAPADQARELLTGRDDVWIATVNGPTSTVVAGSPAALTDVMAQAETTGIRARAIAVDYASHTPHVDRIREQLLELAAPITPRAGDVPLYSTVTAAPIDGETLDAEYWYRNLREQVRFHDTLRTSLANGHTLYLEASPHPVLTTAVQETNAHAIPTLRRDHGGIQQLLTTLATLWTHGLTPNWPAVLTPNNPTPASLPTYPFQRHRYWLDTATPGRHRANATTGPDPHTGFWEAVEREDLEGLARTLRLGESQAELTTLLPALSAWHRRQSAASTMDAWRYREGWRPLPDTASSALSGTWLVVLAPDQKGDALYEAIATALDRHGATVETVVVAPDDPRRWADTLAALTAHTTAHATAPVVGVLSLLARDEAAGLHRTLRLVQGLEAVGLFAPLWCVTQGAVSVGDHDPLTGPAQALVWGLGRVAAQELATRWGGLVDLPQELDERATVRLCAVLAAGGHEDQVAVRATGILGRRVVRAPRLGDVLDDGWSPGPGTVLITGGTGALGSQVARRLAARGAEHLLLVSRRGDTAPGADELVAEVTASGAKATVAACDVGDADALRALLASIPPAYPLTSVFHTAAVLDDAAITSLTPEQVDRVLRVKADAAWRLHELTRDLELSAFVLFSSLAGTVGMVGQGNYAPANAYMDALARHRRSRGLVATSVAWGSWAQGGMAERDAVTELRLRHGVPLLPPESALLALEAALADGETALVIADIDWDRFAHAYTAARPSHLLDEISEARRALGAVEDAGGGAPGGGTGDTAAALRDRLADAKPEERERRLLEAVRGQVAAVLGHGSAEAVGTRRPFLELGLDSVTAVELRNRLGSVTGLQLPATVIFDFPTVAELVDYLSAQLFSGIGADPDGTGQATTGDGTAELDGLERLLVSLPSDAPARSEIADRLRRLLRSAMDAMDVVGTVDTAEEPVTSDDLEAATNDELFDYIEKEFGIS